MHDDVYTINDVVAAIFQHPWVKTLIVADDFNANLSEIERYHREGGITSDTETAGL